jgi:hypothetical protein
MFWGRAPFLSRSIRGRLMTSTDNLRSRLDCLFNDLHQASDDTRLNVGMGAWMYDDWMRMSLHSRFRACRLKRCRAKKYQSQRCREHGQSNSQMADCPA